LRTVNYISNRVPTWTLYHSIPYQRYLHVKPDLSHLRLFGSLAYLHIKKSSKLEPKSKPMILVGYDNLSKAYKCFNYTRRKIIISRDMVFNERQLGIPNTLDPSSAHDDTFLKFLSTNTNPDHSPSSDSLLCSDSPLVSDNPQSSTEVPLFSPESILPPITFPSLLDPFVTPEVSQPAAQTMMRTSMIYSLPAAILNASLGSKDNSKISSI
jgi:hypothetical protein